MDSGADYNASIFNDPAHPTETELELLRQKISACAAQGVFDIKECLSQEGVFDDTPESKALDDAQIVKLRSEINNSAPKIVFMHHPVMSSRNDDSPLNNPD